MTTSADEQAVAASAEAPIEVDVVPQATGSDADSVIDEQLSAFTASLTSSVLNYPVEHGRRYHAYRSGAYPMPNDEPELERLDLIHSLMTTGIGNKLYLAPVEKEKIHRILDVGTGTGIWAISIADIFPNAEILGNDLSPVQPEWVPPNVKFEVDDVDGPWLFSVPFDYVFCRYMAASILDWPHLVESAFDNITPGGWVEFQDFDFAYYSEDGSLKPDGEIMKYIDQLLATSRSVDREPSPGPHLEAWVKDAGFENVVHHRFKFPVGPWPKDPHLKKVGLLNMAQLLDGLEGFSLRLFCGVLGWTEAEVQIMLAKVRQELKDPNIHPQFDFHVVYGQKPAA